MMAFMLRYKIEVFLLIFTLAIGSQSYFVDAENSVPGWVKNTAGWWAEDKISENEFVKGIEFLINEDIIQVAEKTRTESTQNVPDWVKNTAGWWATDAISETEFVNAIEFLVQVNIISVDEKASTDNFDYLSKKVVEGSPVIIYNEEGLRDVEVYSKLNNEYRIIMVGGSTIFGTGVEDNETIPHYLENQFKKMSFDKDIRVINAGIPSAWSETEVSFIHEKLVKLKPDLFIVYDGWNDLDRFVGSINFKANPTYWNERWTVTCEKLSEEGIKTMILLQPFVGTGNRIITDQEFMNYYPREEIHERYLENYELYAEEINELNDNCAKAVDLRNIFDGKHRPLYWDLVHLGVEGNRLVAEEIFYHSRELVDEKQERYHYEKNPDKKVIKLKKNLGEDLNLNSKFIELSNHDFTGRDLSNFDFRFSKISNVSFQGADLTNAKFSRSNLENINFNDANLENADFFGVELNNSEFKNANLKNSDLRAMRVSNGIFENTYLENADFSNSIIFNSKFSSSEILNSKFNSAKLINNDLKGLDFSKVDITGTIDNNTRFAGSDLSNVSFKETNLKNVNFSMYYYNNEIFEGANLTSVDFYSNPSINEAIFSQMPFAEYDKNEISNSLFIIIDRFILKEEIKPTINAINDCTSKYGSNTELESRCMIGIANQIGTFAKINYALSDIKNYGVKLTNANLSGLDLSGFSVSEWYVDFFQYYTDSTLVKSDNMIGLDLQNANLSNSNLENVDLSFSNLDGADLRGANLTNTNLYGTSLNQVNLDGAVLKCKNNLVCE